MKCKHCGKQFSEDELHICDGENTLNIHESGYLSYPGTTCPSAKLHVSSSCNDEPGGDDDES